MARRVCVPIVDATACVFPIQGNNPPLHIRSSQTHRRVSVMAKLTECQAGCTNRTTSAKARSRRRAAIKSASKIGFQSYVSDSAHVNHERDIEHHAGNRSTNRDPCDSKLLNERQADH